MKDDKITREEAALICALQSDSAALSSAAAGSLARFSTSKVALVALAALAEQKRPACCSAADAIGKIRERIDNGKIPAAEDGPPPAPDIPSLPIEEAA